MEKPPSKSVMFNITAIYDEPVQLFLRFLRGMEPKFPKVYNYVNDRSLK